MKLTTRRGVGFAIAALLTTTTLTACADVPTAEVGECLNSVELEGEEVSSLTTFPCDESHDLEVYEVKDLPDGDFPGDDAVTEAAEELCLAAFEPYVGAEYEESEVYIRFLNPTEDSWNTANDREVLCLLESEETTGSLEGSGK